MRAVESKVSPTNLHFVNTGRAIQHSSSANGRGNSSADARDYVVNPHGRDIVDKHKVDILEGGEEGLKAMVRAVEPPAARWRYDSSIL